MVDKQGYKRALTRTRTQAPTHVLKYIMLIAYSRQQWFRERASLVRNTYIACLVCITRRSIHDPVRSSAVHLGNDQPSREHKTLHAFLVL
jgi:hypothetical protein